MGNTDWIPIEEAPDELKDGREVLMWAGTANDGWAAIGRWSRGGHYDQPTWIDTRDGFSEPLASFVVKITPP